MAQPKIPNDATNLECFAIKNNEAFIGYKLPNGNFNFIQIPYTEPKNSDIKRSVLSNNFGFDEKSKIK